MTDFKAAKARWTAPMPVKHVAPHAPTLLSATRRQDRIERRGTARMNAVAPLATEHAALMQRVMEQNIVATSPWLGPTAGFGLANAVPAYAGAPFMAMAHAQASVARAQRAIGVVVAISIAMTALGIVVCAMVVS